MARLLLFISLAAFGIGSATSAADLAFYEKQVQPLLDAHCLKCHGGEGKVRGGLKLTSRRAILAGGDSGPAYDPQRPENSLLLKAILYQDEHYRMPPKGKLPAADLAILTRWITEGLVMPEGSESAPSSVASPMDVLSAGKRYWAYQPVQKPSVPVVKDRFWVRTPVDAFIRQKLEAAGLSPTSPAERAVLVRRAYFDLWGLPPTPEQVDAFVQDSSPDAWPRLIDQLLASPHYGEKWGRHWLDVVRFAETNGYERDGPKPNAWRYRDYVIRSFNDDKPFDQFIREQIAGDEFPEWSADAIIATGFYRLGLWDDEPADPLLALYDGYDDIVTVIGQGFLGMTLNCARCHDHKADPITQRDYYSLLAFVRDIRPYSETRNVSSPNNTTDITPPEERKKYEGALQAREKELKELERVMKPIEDAAIKKMPPEDQLKVDDGKREQVLRKVPRYLDEASRAEYLKLADRRRQLLAQPLPIQQFALSVNNCLPNPPRVHVLGRGNPRAPGVEVQPAFPAVLGAATPQIPPPPPNAKSSGRRTVLADWLASPTNPLTARVIVNRIWQYHFGRGIVPTANDFGRLGEPPSHPELLDWLASDFMSHGWRIKRLHRLIMTSQVYLLSSQAHAEGLAKDPANKWLWRFPMRRLAAEEVRDAMLAVSGQLNRAIGGPSVYPKIPAAILAGQSRPGEGWPTSPKDQANRRSVYVHVKRSLQVPILAAHDQADTDSSCPVRYVTTVPTQALGLLNGEFTHDLALAFADRLRQECPGRLEEQVSRGIRLTTGRNPQPKEVQQDIHFIQSLIAQHGLDERTALARYALLLLNTNEFFYVD